MNKIIKISTSNYLKGFLRNAMFHKRQYSYHTECLSTRSLVKVNGKDSLDFLQGLITNDVHLLSNVTSLYSMFLNVQGRILFDCILLKDGAENIILDCDTSLVDPLINHMKLYKVRRKVNFEHLKSLSIWAAFDSITENKSSESSLNKELLLSTLKLPVDTIVYPDPRLRYLGWRIILPSGSSIDSRKSSNSTNESFQTHKFKLGVAEGVAELPRGKCLPFEANLDYLQGVNFEKGCYIGQELTARTYHTGVVRKRFMPLKFENEVSIEMNSSIVNEKGKNCGKVMNVIGQHGIGILRVSEALNSQILEVGKSKVTTQKPFWWPNEL